MRYKVYPREAIEQHWEGTARVRVHIGTDGKIAGITIVSSAGHDVLDEKARVAVSKGKPLTQIPASLKGQEFDADVRVVFGLENQAAPSDVKPDH
jgi:TonB family protein